MEYPKLRCCPFCGCRMQVAATAQLTGDKDHAWGFSADGNHLEGCPLEDEVIAMRKTAEECAACWNMGADA